MELFPAIDLRDGKAVRLVQGDYNQMTVFSDRPEEVALGFKEQGAKNLHVVDLDGAKAGHIVNYRTLERIASHTSLSIDFGGGLKQDDDLRIAFESGAQKVTGGSIAIKDPDRFAHWISAFGSDRIILGADVKDKKIAISGWKETTDQALLPFLKAYQAQGITQAICTDIACDGMLQGPSIALYQEVLSELPDLKLIASGGVGSLADIERLAEAGVPAVIFGKAIYEGRIQLKELLPFLQ